jgi:broad specificity phosphatase PhoE
VRIGLLRHFPVDQQLPAGWSTAAELQAWRQRYDIAEVLAGEFDLGGVTWDVCICSDLPRACFTAKAVFRGEIGQTPLLREVEFAQFKTGRLRLPVWAWHWLLRFAWFSGHRSQRACRDDFRRRVLSVADRLSALDRDTLVVSHAGVMAYLSVELRRRGFVGPKLRIASHATAYIYEKNGSQLAPTGAPHWERGSRRFFVDTDAAPAEPPGQLEQ